MIIIFIHEWHKKHWLAVLVTWDISCVGWRHFNTLHRCHHRHRHHHRHHPINEHAKMLLGFPWSLISITFWFVFNSFWHCWAFRRGSKLSNSSMHWCKLLNHFWHQSELKGQRKALLPKHLKDEDEFILLNSLLRCCRTTWDNGPNNPCFNHSLCCECWSVSTHWWSCGYLWVRQGDHIIK